MSRRSLLFAIPLIGIVTAGGVAWTLMAREHPPGDPADADQVAIGSALYSWNCARCHGEDLSGELGWAKEAVGLSDEDVQEVAERLGDVAPAHDKSGSTSRLSDDVLFRVIDEGPEEVLDKPDSRMPGFNDRLVEEEIWSIIAFMKHNWQTTADNKDS
ncbi:MAG: c-type cytochrome [Pseudomonadota bacterium]